MNTNISKLHLENGGDATRLFSKLKWNIIPMQSRQVWLATGSWDKPVQKQDSSKPTRIPSFPAVPAITQQSHNWHKQQAKGSAQCTYLCLMFHSWAAGPEGLRVFQLSICFCWFFGAGCWAGQSAGSPGWEEGVSPAEYTVPLSRSSAVSAAQQSLSYA